MNEIRKVLESIDKQLTQPDYIATLTMIFMGLYFMVTILIYIQNIKSARAAKETAEVAKKQYNLLTVPRISLGIKKDFSGWFLIIKNEGYSTANDIKYKIDKFYEYYSNVKNTNSTLDYLLEATYQSMDEKFSLMPNQTLRFWLGPESGVIEVIKELGEFQADLEYIYEGEKIILTSSFNLKIYNGLNEDDIPASEKLVNAIEFLASEINRPNFGGTFGR